MNMIKVNFSPEIIIFVHKPSSFAPFLAVASDKDVRLVRAD
jgi:hypothetical protein